MATLVALTAAVGVYLLYSSLALRKSGLPFVLRFRLLPSRDIPLRRQSSASGPATGGTWRERLGVPPDTSARVLAVTAGGLGLASATVATTLVHSLPASLLLGCLAATVPVISLRARMDERSWRDREAWPRMLDELRVRCAAGGRSIPQGLFEVGRNAPDEMRTAFAAAENEWQRSTDFARALSALKENLADPTADAVCETLVVANQLGGTEVDSRLRALADDRRLDVEARKDARSKQAGVRFSRRFVLAVPAGLALAGMSIGDGRAAYASALGELTLLAGVTAVLACWVWAGRLLKLPEDRRVFRE